MKLCNIIAIFLLISVLDGCAEVSSTRISAYPVYPGVGDMGYVTLARFPIITFILVMILFITLAIILFRRTTIIITIIKNTDNQFAGVIITPLAALWFICNILKHFLFIT